MTKWNKVFLSALTVLFSAGMAAPTSHVVAQERVQACETQQELEQVHASDGKLTRDGCRIITVTRVTSDHGPLCVLDFTGGKGVLDTLRDAALTQKWWITCADLSTAVRIEP